MPGRRPVELHDKAGIGALSDGIFGVALTLLVLDVHLLGASTRPLVVQLLAVWPRLHKTQAVSASARVARCSSFSTLVGNGVRTISARKRKFVTSSARS
jgi:hypothetical protein